MIINDEGIHVGFKWDDNNSSHASENIGLMEEHEVVL